MPSNRCAIPCAAGFSDGELDAVTASPRLTADTARYRSDDGRCVSRMSTRRRYIVGEGREAFSQIGSQRLSTVGSTDTDTGHDARGPYSNALRPIGGTAGATLGRRSTGSLPRSGIGRDRHAHSIDRSTSCPSWTSRPIR
jgi:hypothetical protein